MANKVGYNENFGLDLDKVVAWKRIPTRLGSALLEEKDWDLELYFSSNTLHVEKNALGEEAFNNLLQHLVEGFPFPEEGLVGKAFG